jgi:hypothetical protein
MYLYRIDALMMTILRRSLRMLDHPFVTQVRITLFHGQL